MSVRLIIGGVGSGKTRFCVNEIKKVRAAAPERRCVVLVPTHFSHETEKLIIDKFGGTGLNNIDVTSFEKLSEQLLTGVENRIAAPGKQAIVTRAVRLAVSELSRDRFDGRLLAAAEKRGFADIAAALISELRRYGVSYVQLREKAGEMGDGLLRQKLEITALIAEKFENILAAADHTDSDEGIIRLAQAARDIFDSKTSIWIDKFDEFLPRQLAVVRSIIDSGAEVAITFTDNGEDTYYGTRAAVAAISEYADTEIVKLAGCMRHITSAPDLRFLFSTWFDRRSFSGNVNNAELFEARDAYTETEHTACKILDLIREDNYRFRDISVICGNQESYSHIIEAVFDEYNIPYYTDERFSISEHPIAMQILALFDIDENNWDYLSMFEYLRAGFVYWEDKSYRPIPDDKIDMLENYVLKFAIRGRSMWEKRWEENRKSLLDQAFAKEREAEEYSDIDAVRAAVVAPIAAYCDANKRTVHDYCCALYKFLEDINLYKGLKAELLGMAMNRATADAERFGQIWNLILDIIDQVNTVLGDSETTSEEFRDMIRAAMTKCTIRTIPSGVDRIFIGSVEKNRSDNSKVIFAIGACAGTFPSEIRTEGFFSNSDREALAGADIQLAPTTTQRSEKSAYDVYRTLSAVCDRLYISYPIQTPDSRACRPAQLVLDVCAKLKNIPRYSDIVYTAEEEKMLFISSPAATLHKMLIRPKSHPLWKYVDEWFDEHGEWHNRLFTVRSATSRYGTRIIVLDEDIARMLYKKPVFYSPTHLDTYARCPFKNFLKYGICARERDEHEITAKDAGTYAHEIIRRFCDEIDMKYGWETVSDEQRTDVLNSILEETIENISNSELYDKERMADIMRRMGKTVDGVSKTVIRSISCGGFTPCEYEKKIKVELAPDIGIVGTIDRVDVCEHDGLSEYRIIDYKTGNTQFSVANICAGLDMQLVIYSLAIAAENDKAVVSGMYYSKMRNDYPHIGSTGQMKTVRNALKKNTMLDGATFLEIDNNGAASPEAVSRIESDLERQNGSLFFDEKKNGLSEIRLGGNVHSRAAASALMSEVRGRIIAADKEMRSGRIDIAPLKSGMDTVCKFCEYSSVCKFDEAAKTVRSVEDKDIDVWKRFEGTEL